LQRKDAFDFVAGLVIKLKIYHCTHGLSLTVVDESNQD